jgi:hypothetical protein
MPRTMVQRIAKGVLPTGHIIQKDSITAFSKSATVFINYISHAWVSLPPPSNPVSRPHFPSPLSFANAAAS